MIISAPTDYRKYAKKTLPPFLFDYIDGGANAEVTLGNNTKDLQQIALKQRVLRNVEDLDIGTEIFGQKLSMPVVLAPVGLTGMYARRGEIQALKAAKEKGIAFTMSSVSVCPIEEAIQKVESPPLWFQLYVLKDRGFMKNVLERAIAAGVKTLVFTVDMPTPGSRYRDAHSGMSGPFAAQRRIFQAMLHPKWALDVGLLGTPHDLGNVSTYLGKPTNLADYMGWLGANFDQSIAWKDLEWIRDFWKGDIIIKGILNQDDANDAKNFGANGIVVSNHGGRQLDGVISTTRALPAIADKVKGDMKILVDSGIRSGLDVVRMLALGADVAMIGRAYIYALAADGERGVKNLLDIFAKEMKVAMTLTGVKSVSQINNDCLEL
ncbi:FMN-dependent L-lactate dehydrogenase LldD [Pseudaquidulcibacter saccharophilus]|uniref:FMN-dependent L-lactate dehydrogenase LldD n=1 Tax=Pseudaquidulcibacter saccharophilus TaxID=2831900 RepID=UPI001EFF2197|nr:FMN-dependent L-lactate dehydrogenase LldD [Pseudaquidulcibacter saccharophilus]